MDRNKPDIYNNLKGWIPDKFYALQGAEMTKRCKAVYVLNPH